MVSSVKGGWGSRCNADKQRGRKANENTCEREVTAARMRERTCIHARINVIKQTQWGESARTRANLGREQKGERARVTRRKKLL